MQHLTIKVCGMREPRNIKEVEGAGADWMGFIFWEHSPRYVSRVPDYLPLRCRRVGVFVNPDRATVEQKVQQFGLDIIQLHGQESPEFCTGLAENRSLAIMKAFSISDNGPFPDTRAYEGCCDCFLFDTKCSTAGGSGISFNWDRLSEYRGKTPFLLSGGIGPEHLEALRRFSHPQWAGVDVNSGFEISPGLKDSHSLQLFINGLKKTGK